MKHNRTTLFIVIGFSIMLALSLLALPPSVARLSAAAAAPTFTVNSPFDVAADPSDTNYSICRTTVNNSVCTLRAAVMKANRFVGGGATIIIPAGAYTLTIASAPPYGDASGGLDITQSVTIRGAGMDSTFIDGNAMDTVFRVATGTSLLSQLTVRNGSNLNGGGIANDSVLTLDRVHLTGNHSYSGGGLQNSTAFVTITHSLIDNNVSSDEGGGIANSGRLIIQSSRIANNHADVEGGGIASRHYVDPMGVSVTLDDVSISGNSAAEGGGIHSSGYYGNVIHTFNRTTFDGNSASQDGGAIYVYTGTTLTLNNSTISANSAGTYGGGIMNFGSAHVFLSTIAGNLTDSDVNATGGGGGLYNGGSLNLWSSVLAENNSGVYSQGCSGAPILSQDYNYSQDGCGFSGTTTHNLSTADPLLGPLRDNGGATSTRAPWAGSILTDHIPSNVCRDAFGQVPASDQRNIQRPVHSTCDIGAYEGSVNRPLFNANLLRNGDAEDNGGSPPGAFVAASHWEVLQGKFTVVRYGNTYGFPAAGTDVVPATHGYNLFAGGSAVTSQATQLLSVTAAVAQIGTGHVKYALSGDFGGYVTDNDRAKMQVSFLNQSYISIGGSITIGDFDATYRGNQTGLFHASAAGLVPSGTRYIQVTVTMQGFNGGYNDGYADNLSVVLRPPDLYLPLILR